MPGRARFGGQKFETETPDVEPVNVSMRFPLGVPRVALYRFRMVNSQPVFFNALRIACCQGGSIAVNLKRRHFSTFLAAQHSVPGTDLPI